MIRMQRRATQELVACRGPYQSVRGRQSSPSPVGHEDLILVRESITMERDVSYPCGSGGWKEYPCALAYWMAFELQAW